MNPLIEHLIEAKGVPETSIILLLLLPFVATIIAFWRQIVGLRTFGIYAPIVITFSFYQLALTDGELNVWQGVKYGVALAVIVFISATIAHEITKRIRLHYLPKMSIVISLVVLAVFSVLILASYLNKEGFISIDTLPLLLMITASEQMISIYIKKGRKAAYILTLGTIMISLLSYLLISWSTLQQIILRYPYLTLVMIILNLIIGKWTGFRLKEYFRFRTILTPSEPNQVPKK